MTDLASTHALLNEQLTDAIAADALGTLPTIAQLQRDADEHLKDAVRRAALTASWREIADGLGVSKQAAHQRFKAYAKDVGAQIRDEHRAIRRAKRSGDAAGAAQARARRDGLTEELKASARSLKD
jgi:hypothetical protein